MKQVLNVSGESSVGKCSDRGLRAAFTAWWSLTLHLIFSVLLAVVVSQVLQGKQVAISQDGEKNLGGAFQLSQPQVVALISAALVLIRVLAGFAVTLIGWRMAFLTLGKGGVSLSQVDRMISWRQPPLRGNMILWAVFLASIPSQFAAPVLQGAVNWIPDYVHKQEGARLITTPVPGQGWIDHNTWTNNRYYEVLRAVGIASLASADNFKNFSDSQIPPSIPSRRLIPSLIGSVAGSQLDSVLSPVFRVHSIQWAASKDELGADKQLLDEVIGNSTSETLAFSNYLTTTNGSLNLFSMATDDARLVLVNDKGWQPATKTQDPLNYTWPSPTIHQAQSWIVLGIGFESGCAIESMSFGQLSTSIYRYPYGNNCYMFARMNYTAGVVTCKDCNIVVDAVVESPGNVTAGQVIQAHSLVETAIAMIPEVLFYTKVSNSSLAPTWNNLNGYTCGMVATAYQASWNSIAIRFGESVAAQLQDTTMLNESVAVLRADVSVWRVWLWMVLNALLTIAGLALFALEHRSGWRVVQNSVARAFLMDSNALPELQKAASLTKEHLCTRIKTEQSASGCLKLVKDVGNENMSSYRRKGYAAPTMQEDVRPNWY